MTEDMTQKKKFRPPRWVPVTFFLLGTFWLLQLAWSQVGAHGVVVRNINYDAGTVKNGTLINHAVRLTNLSAQTVSVDAVPSCGCTVADLPFQPLAPFHSESVGLEVDTTGMASGAQTKFVAMHFHSGTKSWQMLSQIKFHLQ